MIFDRKFIHSTAAIICPSMYQLRLPVLIALLESFEELLQICSSAPFSRTGELYGTLSATSTMVGAFDNHVVGDGQCVIPIQLSYFLTGNLTCTAHTINNSNCPVLEAINTLYFGRNFTHLEVFHVAHIVDHFLRLFTEGIVRLTLLQIGDKCILVRMILYLVDQVADKSSSSIVFMLDCCVGY